MSKFDEQLNAVIVSREIGSSEIHDTDTNIGEFGEIQASQESDVNVFVDISINAGWLTVRTNDIETVYPPRVAEALKQFFLTCYQEGEL